VRRRWAGLLWCTTTTTTTAAAAAAAATAVSFTTTTALTSIVTLPFLPLYPAIIARRTPQLCSSRGREWKKGRSRGTKHHHQCAHCTHHHLILLLLLKHPTLHHAPHFSR
jgi:hypothetical protein